MRCAEVHRSAFYLADFARRDGYLVDGDVEVGVDGNNVVQNGRSGVGYAGQVEEAVVGQVDYRSLVGSGSVFDYQSVCFVLQAIGHFYFQVAGEAFFAVGRCVVEDDGCRIGLYSIPYACVEACGTTVQGVGAVVDGQLVFFAIQGELSFGNSVAVSSDGGVQEGFGTVDDAFNIVVS